jgi:hypothetical protein
MRRRRLLLVGFFLAVVFVFLHRQQVSAEPWCDFAGPIGMSVTSGRGSSGAWPPAAVARQGWEECSATVQYDPNVYFSDENDCLAFGAPDADCPDACGQANCTGGGSSECTAACTGELDEQG